MVHIKLGFVITVSFFRINFRFQANLCKNCHNVLQKNIIFNEISILFVKEIPIECFLFLAEKMEGDQVRV